MSIFKKLFGNKKSNDGPMPQRPLNLQFSVTSDNGENFANQFIAAVKQNELLDLTYSIDTLNFVDNFLQKFKDQGLSVNDFAETIFVAGCYIGQMMVVNNGAIWINEDEANLPEGIHMTNILIKLPDGSLCDPIAKAFKRFYHGDSDSITYFYHMFTAEVKGN